VAGFAFAGSPCPPYGYSEDESACERGIRDALDRAGIPPSAVDLVMVSRNGRTGMDAMEPRVLSRLSGEGPARVSVKDSIGEMAAAGGAEARRGRQGLDAGWPTALFHSFGSGGNFLSVVLTAP
jgi:3-oxoacyl-(acyl-carrier-protein) synthase